MSIPIPICTPQVNITDEVIALAGAHNIIGLSVVVHADPDDLGRGGYPDSKTKVSSRRVNF